MNFHLEDTIAAISSATGHGLRGIVRLTGPDCVPLLQKLLTHPFTPAVRQVATVDLQLSGINSPLPAQVYYWQGPKSYTGQDVLEIHTIGSPPLLDRLVADLISRGARPAQPGEFTLRAFLSGKKDLTQTEAVLAVIESNSSAELNRALEQLAGGISHPLVELREDLLNLLADVEAALDFGDEDITFISSRDLLNRLGSGIARLLNAHRQLDDRSVSGRPIRIVFAGRPNAGKSSLFNALLGKAEAIVSSEAGTTRDYLSRVISINGIDIEYIDTAGRETAQNAIDSQAQKLGSDQASQADIILWCVPRGESFEVHFREEFSTSSTQILKVHTQADRFPATQTLPDPSIHVCSIHDPASIARLESVIVASAEALVRPSLATSQSRCRAHIERALVLMRECHHHALFEDPPELLASALRAALDQIGELTGEIYTNDLLDRIFSRFCIGK